jgi:signal transduction histidine kinase
VYSLAFNAGSDLLASASADGTVKLWNARDGQCRSTLTNKVYAETLAYLPGAQLLAAGMADGTVEILTTNDLATVREWPAHSGRVQSLALSDDGRWLATAGADRTVAVWDWQTGRELRRFTNVISQYLPLAFYPHQPVLAFAQSDDTVVHANVETGEILFQRTLFADGEWLAWNPAKAFYMASPHGDRHARLRFIDQLVPVYPLELYRSELYRGTNLLAAIAGPAPVLAPKNFARWWYWYPHKRAWLDSGLTAVSLVVVFYLWRGWRADRRRRAQEAFSRQLLISQEGERKRIAAELHDSLGQNLLIIKNRLYLAQQAENGAAPAEQLHEIEQTVTRTIAEVREIAYNLRPYQLDRLGLTKAVQSVVERISASGFLQIESKLADVDGLFSPEIEINFYRIVQESLNNVIKHSDAARALISIQRAHGMLVMGIEDDGRGFDLRQTMHDAKTRGFGLTGLGERVRLLGGTFECDSAPGKGTRLTFKIPIRAKE